MPGKEEWVLEYLGSQHKCVEWPVRPVFPDYLFLVTMVKLGVFRQYQNTKTILKKKLWDEIVLSNYQNSKNSIR